MKNKNSLQLPPAAATVVALLSRLPSLVRVAGPPQLEKTQ
jgi:hypothetical protein